MKKYQKTDLQNVKILIAKFVTHALKISCLTH
jgi:hypothetical protein